MSHGGPRELYQPAQLYYLITFNLPYQLENDLEVSSINFVVNNFQVVVVGIVQQTTRKNGHAVAIDVSFFVLIYFHS